MTQVTRDSVHGLRDLQEIVDATLSILGDEREAFLQGTYHLVPDISARKNEMVERIENCIKSVPRSAEAVALIRSVIDAGRRNEDLILAARQGLAYARRRISQIKSATRGDVAYAEDGTRISSRADLLGETTTF